ncbi:MAG: hypothetical protein V3R89_04215 [Thermoanaerobaculia bacterium]
MSPPTPTVVSIERLPITTLLGIALVSASALLLEISLTRYFSFRLWYHYAFMIISIALLGLSSAASFLALFRKRIAALAPHRVLGYGAWLAGASVLATLPLLALLNQAWVREAGAVWRLFLLLALYWGVLFVPFFFAGCALSWSIETYSDRISRVYAFDLLGAALGCLAAVGLLSRFLPEQSLAFAAALAMGSSFLFLARERGFHWIQLLGPLGFLLALAAGLWGGSLVGAQVTPTKGLAQDLRAGGVIKATRPGITGRVDVIAANTEGFAWGLAPRFRDAIPPQLALRIDGDALTVMTRYDGDFSKWSFTDYMPSTLPYAVGDPKKVLVIGPGGGMDVVNGVERGAEAVVGVEINGRIIELMQDDFDEFAGHIYRHPSVRIVHSDGRNFVESSSEKFDLIQLTLVDTFAAISSGALSLSEDFLYTTEAFQAYLDSLTPDGYLVLGRTIYEGLPLTVLLDSAIRGLDTDLREHLFIADNPGLLHGLVFLFKRSALTQEEIERGTAFVRKAGLRLLYAPGESTGDPRIAEFLNHPDRDRFIRESPIDLVPETDDKPFYFRSSKWTSLLGTHTGGRGNLLVILAVAILFALGFILAPIQVTAPSGLRSHGRFLLYFAFIGLGFIILEIGLVVKFALFLGHPGRSLTVTLFSLLLFSGLGSRASQGLFDEDALAGRGLPRRAMLPFFAVFLLAVLDAFFLSTFFSAWMGLALGLRIALSVLLIAPLGFLMGMPLPIGMSLLRERGRSFVLWAWGVNGFASVVGSIGCVLLAHLAGYRSAFLVSAGCYLAALLSLLRAQTDGRTESPTPARPA